MNDRAEPVDVPFWGDADDERALERYRTLVDGVTDGIYQLDAEGRFVGVNEMITETTGYAREELLGEHVSIILDDATIERIKRDVRAHLASGDVTGGTPYEIAIETIDGIALTCELRLSLLVSDGEFRGSIGIVRDVTEQKRRERQTEAELEEVVERITDGFLALDTAWTITHINDQAKALLGADNRNLVGTDLWEEFPDAVDTTFERSYRRAMETQEPTTVEEYYPQIDGWFEGHIYPSETGLSVYFRDITERKERERTLAKFRTVVQSVNDGIYTVDEDGHFTMVNDAYIELTGYSREELLGSHVSLVVDDETIQRAKTAETALLEDQNEQPVEEGTVRTADGERVPAEATFTMFPGEGHERIGVVRDITERRERERALEVSERRYRTLVENFPDGAVGLYDEHFTYTVAGGTLLDELGMSSRDVVGETIEERYPDDLVERIKPHFSAVFEGESNTFEVEYHGRNLLAHTLPVRDSDDEIYAGMLLIQDITERTEYRNKLEESNERLEQFASVASHDLQEPLRMISSYLQLLERRYVDDLDEDAEEFIDFAVDGADRMREMIEGLLEYSRIETQGDPLEPVALDDVLDDTLDNLQVRIEESDAEIVADPLPRVRGDESQLQQVFQNLLDNAIEYSHDEPPRIYISAERAGRAQEISIRDEGIGIDPEQQERIFDVFQRLHSSEEHTGTGIGLALCERIVERHGGDIRVESSPGEGTTFAFTLLAEDGA